MRGWRWAVTTASVILVGACAGEVELADRDSISQFEVAPLEPTAEHPCDLLPDDTAADLGILAEDGGGSPQSDTNCFYTDQVDSSVDVRVEEFEDADETVVATTVAAAFSGEDGQEFASVEGYPGLTTEFPDSCNLNVATSDEHELFVQVSADDACETAVEVAAAVIASSPEL
ncbi:DUF3558 family protein [Nocardiopsis nanhaiensis]